jgi:hypothetical protein
MIDPAVLLALAERCETEEPSRKLDAEIAVACRIGSDKVDKDHWSYRNFPVWIVRDDGQIEAGLRWKSPRFTTSLDAAVTLVPVGWLVDVTQTAPERWIVALLRSDDTDESGIAEATAKTEPMARVAAALRALAQIGACDV